MKYYLPLALALITSSLSSVAYAQEAATTRTYALIVANNTSQDRDVEPLRYADDDGARFYEMFADYADETTLLTTLDEDSQRVFPGVAPISIAPTRLNLADQVTRLEKAIERDRKAGISTQLYLVFTGHGNVDETGEGYLSLADSRLKRSDLYRDVIRPLNAEATHVIIDACNAYFMVRARGGDWKDDRTGQTLDAEFQAYLRDEADTKRGTGTIGVILSTAGAAEVHEWSRFRAGVFSHQLRSGLLGAADADANGHVSYPEIEAYLVAANAAVTNPRAKIHVYVEGPRQERARTVTRIDAFRNATQLSIPAGIGGRFSVEDARGLRYADMHLDPSTDSRLVLLKAPVQGRPYFLRRENDQATVPTTNASILSSTLAYIPLQDQARGAVDESFRTELFATPFGPAFVAGYSAGRENTEMRIDSISSATPDSTWTVEIPVEYTVSTAPLLDATGLQHNLALQVGWRHVSGWGVGPYAEYGITPDGAATLHRFSLGIDGSYVQAISAALDLGVRLRIGHQTLLFDADELRSDPIGLRAEAAVLAGWMATPSFSAHVVGGLAVDVVTRADLIESSEDVTPVPFAGIGVRF